MRHDAKRALGVLTRAFWEFPETVHLLPNERNRRHALPRFFASDLNDCGRFDGVRLAERDGLVAGAIAFLPPGAYPVTPRRQILQLLTLAPALPWGVAAAREARRGSNANAAAHRRQGEPHYFIQVVGVDPDFQRQGIGTELITPVLRDADATGVGCFLFTATEANAAWYHSLGFETTTRYHPTPRWPEVWAMWRPPA